jgi:hypothetical protein
MSEPILAVELPLAEASQGPEEAAIVREAVEEAWQALEQALLQLDRLPPERAWQVLLAPFGLRVAAAVPGVGTPASVREAGES